MSRTNIRIIECDCPQDPITLHCDLHGEYTGRPFPLVGKRNKAIEPSCPVCVKEEVARREEDEHLDRRKNQQAWIEERLGQVGIAKRFQGKDFDGYQANTAGQKNALAVAQRYAETLPERIEGGDCLAFHGGPGTGKSHLAAAIVRMAFHDRLTSIYLTVTDLVLMARSTYHQNAKSTLRDEMNVLNDVDLLVIDEVGQPVGREDHWLLFHLIDTRYRAQKPVIVISNLDRQGLTEYLGERAMDRLGEGSGMVVSFDWDSWRCRRPRIVKLKAVV